MKHDIEANLKYALPEIDQDFLHRMIAFSLSGSTVVDLSNFENKKAKIACGLRSEYLTSFLCQIVFQRRKKMQLSRSKDLSIAEMKSPKGSHKVSLNSIDEKNSEPELILSSNFQELI